MLHRLLLVVFPEILPRGGSLLLLLRSILFVCLEAIRPGRDAQTSVIHLVICLCFEVPRSAVTSAETYILHVLQPLLGVQQSTKRFRTVCLHLEVSPADCNNGAGRRRESGRETLKEERSKRTLGAPEEPIRSFTGA